MDRTAAGRYLHQEGEFHLLLPSRHQHTFIAYPLFYLMAIAQIVGQFNIYITKLEIA
jgi:hypothetical protein